MITFRCAGFLGATLLCGCPPAKPAVVDAGAPVVVDAGVAPVAALSAADRAKLESTLQEALTGKDCPPGTRRTGAEPPEGHEVWCERTGKDGKPVKHGPYEAWHDNGVKSVSGAYVDNERDGHWVTWHDNGQRKQETDYVKGKPEGRFREWDKKGEPLADAIYKNGKVIK